MNSLPPELAELAAVAGYAPHLAQAFASLACDMALVLDGDGLITRVAHNPSGSLAAVTDGWVGLPLADTVLPQSRPKIARLLDELARQGLARRREVNLPAVGAHGIPVAYTALRLGASGPSLAVGQDLRAVAQMQQRFMRVQQELERGYDIAVRAAGEAHEPLDEASRRAFAAWLRAERMSAEGPAPAPASARKRKRR
jgi:hypothetical protein